MCCDFSTEYGYLRGRVLVFIRAANVTHSRCFVLCATVCARAMSLWLDRWEGRGRRLVFTHTLSSSPSLVITLSILPFAPLTRSYTHTFSVQVHIFIIIVCHHFHCSLSLALPVSPSLHPSLLQDLYRMTYDTCIVWRSQQRKGQGEEMVCDHGCGEWWMVMIGSIVGSSGEWS